MSQYDGTILVLLRIASPDAQKKIERVNFIHKYQVGDA